MPDIRVNGEHVAGSERVLTPSALEFLARLAHEFEPRRQEILAARRKRAARQAAGERLDFLPGTAHVRDSDWQVATAPADLNDRRVEITGPAEAKMTINALNSGAKVFMADFEDSLSPTWANVVGGQAALQDAVRRELTFRSPEGKEYRLNDDLATLVVRPRGWHLVERHVEVDGLPISGSLFDFGLYLFHNGGELLARGSGPYFYLPKLQGHLEARLWNDVFVWAQDAVGVPHGSIRATVLIETIWAAFEMDEILYELREHAAGLNAGRWDYIFSVIKAFSSSPRIGATARSGAGDDGRALHARLPAAAGQDVPPARRTRDRRHERVHSQPAGAGGDREGAGQGARGQGARGGRRLRRHVGRPSRPGARRDGGLRPRAGRPSRTRNTGSATTSSCRAPS